MDNNEIITAILYGLIGESGGLSAVVFVWGMVEYATKIGLPSVQRDRGVRVMEWGVGLLLTAVILAALLKLLVRWQWI